MPSDGLFELGRSYNRRRDIHERFGGQRQGGISTPMDHPIIFAFTGGSGQQFGYEDYWTDDGVFCLYGEGQRGDMQFRVGNKAIRDHIHDGRELLLFEMLGKGRVRYQGQFICESWHEGPGKDVDGRDRTAIIFHLVPTGTEQQAPRVDPPDTKADIGVFRRRALEAGQQAPNRKDSDAKRRYWERSLAVRAYVLHRADGVCEACDSPAPFKRSDGTSFLEVHHIRRLSDEGPDDPRFCAAVCPNCHREAHHGQGGDELNARLQATISEKESNAG